MPHGSKPHWPTRRTLLHGAVAATLLPRVVTAAAASPKVLRYAFRAAETSLDPARIGDIYSRTLTAHIFEALFAYDPLARPVKLVPLTAAALPEPSADFRVWTVRLRPGIFFADDPAFGGRPRELVAQDYVTMLQRHADPAHNSPSWPALEANLGIVGLAQARAEALARQQPFDYERPIAGLQVPDRHTLRFTLAEPRPRFAQQLAGNDLFGAVAREVVQYYGAQIDAHPVGTGPFRLRQWRRGSLIVLERNPQYRERFYEAEPGADDAEGQALLARFKGRRLPMIDRVEVSVTAEEQPRWLAFQQAQAGGPNFIERVAPEFAATALPGGQLAPHLARRGMQARVQAEPGATMLIFNMEDAVVGGYTPAQVALRRAIALALDTPREISLLQQGRALPAQSPLPPFTSGYDPGFRSEMSQHDPARARALLDLYRPAGAAPLRVELAAQVDQISRPLYELWQRNLRAVGVQLVLRFADWSENLKAARAGRFMLWTLSDAAASAPDGLLALARYDSRQVGGQNLARFRQPAFDTLLDRLAQLPDGPERLALFTQAQRLAVAWMPYKARTHRLLTDMWRPELVGYRRPVFATDWWQWIDIETPASSGRG